MNLSASDPSGVRYVQYCWGAGASCEPTQTPGNDLPFNCTGVSPCAADVTQSGDGSWTLCARGMDALNNWTNPQACSSPYQKDAALPTATITAPPTSSWQRTNFAVSVTDTDTGGSGLASCMYGVRSYNGSSWVQILPDTTLRACNTPFTVTVGALANCRNEGNSFCEVRVRSSDVAGNLGPVNSRGFSIDWTPPNPNPPSILASGNTTNSITWTLSTGSDAHSGLDPLPYRFSRTSGGPYTAAVQASPAWPEGGLTCGTSYTRYGIIQDLAGNVTNQGGPTTSSTLSCAPPAPTGFTGSNNYSTSQIRWAWNAAAGADTYFVYSNPGGVFQCLATAPTTFCISILES
ncbi:MAG: hypothetical protein UW12_C0007G0013 [Parcubacteria group bacterium GW2011_GWF1_43_9]|nr:MAG: hypothetical protein UW12_C0007G0013 [Parcubacteria group bacterium GW2011_GWF1_43_9]